MATNHTASTTSPTALPTTSLTTLSTTSSTTLSTTSSTTTSNTSPATTSGATNDEGDKAAVIIGSVVASVIIVIIISVIVIVIAFKRWQKRKDAEKKENFVNRLKDYNELSITSDNAEPNHAYSNKSNYSLENSSENLQTPDSTKNEKVANDDKSVLGGNHQRTFKLSNQRTDLKNTNAYAIVSIYTSSDNRQEITEVDKARQCLNCSSEHSFPTQELTNNKDSGREDRDTMNISNPTNVSKCDNCEIQENNQCPIYYELEKVVDGYED